MIAMSVNKYRKGGMTKRNGSYTFVLVMLQLPAHSDTTIQGTCTYLQSFASLWTLIS